MATTSSYLLRISVRKSLLLAVASAALLLLVGLAWVSFGETVTVERRSVAVQASLVPAPSSVAKSLREEWAGTRIVLAPWPWPYRRRNGTSVIAEEITGHGTLTKKVEKSATIDSDELSTPESRVGMLSEENVATATNLSKESGVTTASLSEESVAMETSTHALSHSIPTGTEAMRHNYMEKKLQARIQKEDRLSKLSSLQRAGHHHAVFAKDNSWLRGANTKERARYIPAGSDPSIRHSNIPQQRAEYGRAQGYHDWPLGDDKLPSLSKKVLNGVEKFVFFVGYPRSGHSIIGSMMDAHPNMIISHEFMLFKKLTQDPFIGRVLQNKTTLFNALYRRSRRDAEIGARSSKQVGKGYTLKVGTPWHGTFNESLKVIGDKSGRATVVAYQKYLPGFEMLLSKLRNTVKRPIRVIHVVRNPYDMIATEALYFTHKNDTAGAQLYRLYKRGEVDQTTLKVEYKDRISKALYQFKLYFFNLAEGVDEMIHRLNLTVLEIHNADFVRDPKEVISRICTFLDLQCPQDYLQACYDKAYKTPSKSRNLLAWPEDVLTDIAGSMEKIPFFRRYSFEGD